MSVRITADENKVALFDSVSGFAFGPTFDDRDEADSYLYFIEHDKDGYFVQDARGLSDAQHERLLKEFAAKEGL
jgi:hypothetical protein